MDQQIQSKYGGLLAKMTQKKMKDAKKAEIEKVKAYRLEDFLTMLKKFNLEIIETFGDYKLNPFIKETSPRLIMILK